MGYRKICGEWDIMDAVHWFVYAVVGSLHSTTDWIDLLSTAVFLLSAASRVVGTLRSLLAANPHYRIVARTRSCTWAQIYVHIYNLFIYIKDRCVYLYTHYAKTDGLCIIDWPKVSCITVLSLLYNHCLCLWTIILLSMSTWTCQAFNGWLHS